MNMHPGSAIVNVDLASSCPRCGSRVVRPIRALQAAREGLRVILRHRPTVEDLRLLEHGLRRVRSGELELAELADEVGDLRDAVEVLASRAKADRPSRTATLGVVLVAIQTLLLIYSLARAPRVEIDPSQVDAILKQVSNGRVAGAPPPPQLQPPTTRVLDPPPHVRPPTTRPSRPGGR